MLATSHQQDVAAQNLAHASKPGYRREVLRFEAGGGAEDLVGPRVSVHADQSPGGFEHTGNPLDVAISGSGLFVVDGPGGPMYSRCGVFQLNGEGQLVTPEGLVVQGIAGPITLPAGAKAVEIVNDGSVMADGLKVDQLRVVEFADLAKLQRVSGTGFAAPKGVEPISVDQPDLRPGTREMSNTTAVQEMVQMTTGLRQFEATQRALRAIGDAIGLTTRPTGR
jgi:flagellar basal body rod protein FlgG